MAADAALVGYVGGDEEEIVVADLGRGLGFGSAVNCHVFAKGVVVSDDELSGLSFILEILGFAAKGGKGKGFAVGADDGVAFDDDVRVEAGMIA